MKRSECQIGPNYNKGIYSYRRAIFLNNSVRKAIFEVDNGFNWAIGIPGAKFKSFNTMLCSLLKVRPPIRIQFSSMLLTGAFPPH